MHLIRMCADGLNKCLDSYNKELEGSGSPKKDVVQIKAKIFNGCSIGVISSIVFGILSSLSLFPLQSIMFAASLGVVSLMGRAIVEDSFRMKLLQFRPSVLLALDHTTIFYKV